MKLRRALAAAGVVVAAVTGGTLVGVSQAPPAAAVHNGGASIHVVSDNFDTYVKFQNRTGIQFTLARNATSCCYSQVFAVWIPPWHKGTVGNYNDNWQRTEWSYDQGHWMVVSYDDAAKPHTYVRTGPH